MCQDQDFMFASFFVEDLSDTHEDAWSLWDFQSFTYSTSMLLRDQAQANKTHKSAAPVGAKGVKISGGTAKSALAGGASGGPILCR